MSNATIKRWVAGDLGPRQAKALEKLLSKLRHERNTHTRITGVHGGESNSYAVSTFGGGGDSTNEAAIEAWDELGEQFNWSVSKKNLKAVRAATEAAIETAKAGRPVVDERQTQDEVDEQNHAFAKQNAEQRERLDRFKANHDALRAKAPAGAVAIIVADYDEDRSDAMTDYFAHTTTRTVAIGWRFSKREDFRRLRKAAATFSETAHLGPDAPKSVEHRDNYSMGSGNYLKKGYTNSTGWRVKSIELKYERAFPYREVEDHLPGAPAKAEPADAIEAGGATVSDSEKNPANVEVRFDEKPDADVRAELKAARFRWSPRFKCWYGKRENLPSRYAAGATA